VTLCGDVRDGCAEIAGSARSVAIRATDADLAALGAIASAPIREAPLDPRLHYLDGSAEDVARFFLTLDSINFGSGWFPALHKQPGRSGYATIAGRLTDHFRTAGPWSNDQLRRIDTEAMALVLAQPADLELMALYAQALRDLGRWLGERTALEAVESAGGSAEAFAELLVSDMAMFHDPPFHKRAQLLASDLELAGVATFGDLDRLTIFADNVVPHVLRCDGILIYEEDLAARIDAEELLQPGREEREIRACALHACELLARHHSVPPRVLDNWLWNRGQAPAYKARPRHRCRCVFY
jgi:hypothetical protein